MPTMTLNISEKEMQVLEELALKKSLSKTAVLKQALRTYQLIEKQLDNGNKMVFVDSNGDRVQLLLPKLHVPS